MSPGCQVKTDTSVVRLTEAGMDVMVMEHRRRRRRLLISFHALGVRSTLAPTQGRGSHKK